MLVAQPVERVAKLFVHLVHGLSCLLLGIVQGIFSGIANLLRFFAVQSIVDHFHGNVFRFFQRVSRLSDGLLNRTAGFFSCGCRRRHCVSVWLANRPDGIDAIRRRLERGE